MVYSLWDMVYWILMDWKNCRVYCRICKDALNLHLSLELMVN